MATQQNFLLNKNLTLKTLLTGLLLISSFVLTSSVSAAEAEMTLAAKQCESLGTDPWNPIRPNHIKGVFESELKADEVIKQCSIVWPALSKELHRHNLMRAYLAKGDLKSTYRILDKLWYDNPKFEAQDHLLVALFIAAKAGDRPMSRSDEARFIEEVDIAAAMNHAVAHLMWAALVEKDLAPPTFKDKCKSIQNSYTRAAGLGHIEGKFQLGSLHVEGKCVEKNEQLGKGLLMEAATAGHLGAVALLEKKGWLNLKQNTPKSPKDEDIYSELRKLKELLDAKIITQKEFDNRKKKILEK